MNVESLRYLEIGHEGDNLVRSVFIDCSQWVIRYLEINQCVIAITRPDKTTYFPKIDYDPNTYTIIWNITRTDTESAGTGYYQIIGLGSDGEVIHSDCNPLVIHANMPGLAGATNEPPESSKTWYEDVMDAARDVKSAVVHNPVIGENGNWYIWNNTTLNYVDSGVASARPSDVYFGTETPPNNEPVWINPEGGVWEMPDVPEDEFELIERYIVGYELLTTKPADWESNWKVYYRNTGTLREPVYTALTDVNAPDWNVEQYFTRANEGVRSYLRNIEPDGNPINLKAMYVKTNSPAGTKTINGYAFAQSLKHINFAGSIAEMTRAKATKSTIFMLPIYGRWFSMGLGSRTDEGQMANPTNYPVRNFMYSTKQCPRIEEVIVYQNENFLPGTEIEIWGVRANA